jgi:PBP1b-binding outer membrane lipoprotein LpoB
MNKTKLRVILSSTILALIILASCNNNDDSENQKNEVKVKLIEQVCCGNLMTLKNRLIESSCEVYRDSLLSPINLSEFPVFQSLKIGDIVTIEYELTENCEATCEIICNRMNGIPIKLLNVEN